MRCELGDKVGYVLRFNEVMSERTQIKVGTKSGFPNLLCST